MSITTIVLILLLILAGLFFYYKFAYSYLSEKTLAIISVSFIFITVGILALPIYLSTPKPLNTSIHNITCFHPLLSFPTFLFNSVITLTCLPTSPVSYTYQNYYNILEVSLFISVFILFISLIIMMDKHNNDKENYESKVIQEVKEGNIKVTITKESPKH